MATSSCESAANEFTASALQSSVDDDSDDNECPLRSPCVRAYVANFESQQHRHHRPLCRTDDVGKHHQQRCHERPHPPCKTTTAVLKARHLRAASDDLSRSWKSTDHSEIASAGRSVTELKMALLNSAKLTSDQDGRRCDRSGDEVGFPFAGDRKGPTSQSPELSVPATSECDENDVDQSPQCESETHIKHSSCDITVFPDTPVDCSPQHSFSEVDGDEPQPQPTTEGDVDIPDSTGDDVGYFSLPGRRADRERLQTTRSRSRSCNLNHNSAIAVDDDEVESSLMYSSDSAGSPSPASLTSTDRQTQPDVASSLDNCRLEYKHCQSPYEDPQGPISTSSPTANSCSDRVVSDSCLSTSDATACSQHSDKLETDEDGQKSAVEHHQIDPCSSSVPPATVEPERLSEMMIASFGRCDEVLCRVVDVVGSYKTAVCYLSSMFPETGLIHQCAFDLTRPCHLDAASTGVQFLTLEAVRVSSVLSFLSPIFAFSNSNPDSSTYSK